MNRGAANLIREAVEALPLKKQEVAEAIGVTPAKLSKLMKGVNAPDERTTHALLGVIEGHRSDWLTAERRDAYGLLHCLDDIRSANASWRAATSVNGMVLAIMRAADLSYPVTSAALGISPNALASRLGKEGTSVSRDEAYTIIELARRRVPSWMTAHRERCLIADVNKTRPSAERRWLNGHAGDKLAAFRDATGMGQSALAEKIGVSQALVSDWESLTSYPSEDALDRIGALFKAQPGWSTRGEAIRDAFRVCQRDAIRARIAEADTVDRKIEIIERLPRAHIVRAGGYDEERQHLLREVWKGATRFPDRLRVLRLMANLTTEAFVSDGELTRTTLTQHENGHAAPRLPIFERYVARLAEFGDRLPQDWENLLRGAAAHAGTRHAVDGLRLDFAARLSTIADAGRRGFDLLVTRGTAPLEAREIAEILNYAGGRYAASVTPAEVATIANAAPITDPHLLNAIDRACAESAKSDARFAARWNALRAPLGNESLGRSYSVLMQGLESAGATERAPTTAEQQTRIRMLATDALGLLHASASRYGQAVTPKTLAYLLRRQTMTSVPAAIEEADVSLLQTSPRVTSAALLRAIDDSCEAKGVLTGALAERWREIKTELGFQRLDEMYESFEGRYEPVEKGQHDAMRFRNYVRRTSADTSAGR